MNPSSILLAMLSTHPSMPDPSRLDDYITSGVSIEQVLVDGSAAFSVRMPSSLYQDPRVETLTDRNLMAWLPYQFRDGTIEVELMSQVAADAPDYARGFIGVSYRISGDGSFENIYLRPTNSTSDDQVRRNHSVQYFAYPDYPFALLRQQSPEKYETYADIAPGKWVHVRLDIKGSTARLYLDHNPKPAFLVNDMKLPSDQRGGIGIWLESGTVGYFRDLRVTPAKP